MIGQFGILLERTNMMPAIVPASTPMLLSALKGTQGLLVGGYDTCLRGNLPSGGRIHPHLSRTVFF